eukprot:scaffold5569_cov42-Phaeocystis_antarctica.AAC.1
MASTSPLVTEPEICEMRGLVILPKRDALPLAFTWLGLGLGLGLSAQLTKASSMGGPEYFSSTL